MLPGLWASITGMLAFFLTFRMSHAYGRFIEGTEAVHQLTSCWFQVLSTVTSCTSISKRNENAIMDFQQRLVRLLSLMNALMFAELECDQERSPHIEAFGFPLIEPHSLDNSAINMLADRAMQPETAFQWIKNLVAQQVTTGVLSVPPPLLTRVFAELDQGIATYHSAHKLATVPFPFPYAVTMETLLLVYSATTPLFASVWCEHTFTAVVFVFFLIFGFWVIHLMAPELENPFGTDMNDLDMRDMQTGSNERLKMLVHPIANLAPELKVSGVVAARLLDIGVSRSFDNAVAVVKCEAEDSWSLSGTHSCHVPRCHDDAGEPDNGSGIDETYKAESGSATEQSLDEKEARVAHERPLSPRKRDPGTASLDDARISWDVARAHDEDVVPRRGPKVSLWEDPDEFPLGV